jgi:osmotically-inducible protein OsmY
MNSTRILIVLFAALALGACASNSPPQRGYDSNPQPTREPTREPASSMSLHDRVHNALQYQMGSSGSDISVRVDGTKVFLSGHVGSQADHDRAHDIAHDVSGVTSVDHKALKVH